MKHSTVTVTRLSRWCWRVGVFLNRDMSCQILYRDHWTRLGAWDDARTLRKRLP